MYRYRYSAAMDLNVRFRLVEPNAAKFMSSEHSARQLWSPPWLAAPPASAWQTSG